jgi:hypothetical protein
MGTPAGTNVVATEFAGLYKVVTVAFTPSAASDTVTLTLASHGISVIKAILGVRILTGQDDAFATIFATFSGLVVTVVSMNAAGGASTNWGSATAEFTVIGY